MTRLTIIILGCLLASSIVLNLHYESKIKDYNEVMHSRRYNAFFWKERYETLLFDFGLMEKRRYWDSCYRDMVTPKVIGNSWPDSPQKGYLSAKDWELFNKQQAFHINKAQTVDTDKSKPVEVPNWPDTPGNKVYTKEGKQ